ncbi:MAG: membrane protein of unknown function [Nitrospira sp.]|nr:MAG: membrane protein of unknown function [Nitrospira sp.]
MIRLLHLEWQKDKRDRSLWIQIALLCLLLVAAAINGTGDVTGTRDSMAASNGYESARMAELQHSAGEIERGHKPIQFATDGSNPARVGGGDGARRAWLPPADFASFAAGYLSALPQSYTVTIWSRHTRTDGYDLRSPANHTSGRFDIGFVCVLLVPLFAIALGYNVVSADRESGTLRLVSAQSVSLPRLIAIRLWLRLALLMAPIATVSAGLYLWTAPEITAEGISKWLVLLGALSCYVAFWLALCGLLNVSGRSSSFNAMTGVCLYLAFTILLPTVIQVAAAKAFPPPARLSLIPIMRTITSDIESGEKSKALVDSYYRDHPEIVPAADSANKMEPRTKLFPKALEFDRRLVPIIKEQEAASQAQSDFARRLSFLSPPFALQLILEQWAGNDLERNRAFAGQVDAYQQAWREFFGPKIMGLATLVPEDYPRLPAFQFREESAGSFWRRAFLPLGSLFAVSSVAAGILGLTLPKSSLRWRKRQVNRGMDERWARKAHRRIGILAFGFLLLSVSTGLLWANARFLYWDDHYKEKIRPLPGPSVETATLPVDRAIVVAKEALGGRASVEQVSLRSDFGRVFYELKVRVEGVATTLLLDALTGERLSPISPELAPVIARQYVRTPATVTGVEMERFTPRKKKRAQDAVRVRFDDADATEIVLDRQTGEILEDEGRWRRVHFAVMQLHQLNFFGFEKTLLNIPGVPILLMSFSGCLLWILHRARMRRSRSVTAARDTALFSPRSTSEPKEAPPLS